MRILPCRLRLDACHWHVADLRHPSRSLAVGRRNHLPPLALVEQYYNLLPNFFKFYINTTTSTSLIMIISTSGSSLSSGGSATASGTGVTGVTMSPSRTASARRGSSKIELQVELQDEVQV